MLGVLLLFLTLVSSMPLKSTSQCAKGLDGKVPSWAPKTFSFSGNVRTYYVAAEQISWNYAPSGWDNWLGVPIEDSPRAAQAGNLASTGSIGSDGGLTWEKAVYRGYTDSSFKTQAEEISPQGIQGPTLRGEVGDLIQILFVNNLSKNYASLHSMGLTYNKGDEGSLYPSTVTGQSKPAMVQEALAPEECTVYTWLIDSVDGPQEGKVSSAKSYHSYVDLEADTNAGLMGPFIVYASGKMNEIMNTNREFPILYMIFDESLSFLAGTNAAKAGMSGGNVQQLVHPHSGNKTIWEPQLRNMPTVSLSAAQAPQFNSINGYVFENGNPFEMCQYDGVIWYLYAYGTNSHAMHLHGNNLLDDTEMYVATKSVQDGAQFQLEMSPSEPGIWELLCHVNDHQNGGMIHFYQVYPQKQCPLSKL